MGTWWGGRAGTASWRRLAASGVTGAMTVLAGVAGCGDPSAVPAVPAAGTVTYKSKPLESGTVQFVPENGRPASGTITAGKFILSTYKDNDGAIPGKHKVAIVSTKDAPAKGGGEPEAISVIPKSFSNPINSGLIIDIPPEGNEKIELNIN